MFSFNTWLKKLYIVLWLPNYGWLHRGKALFIHFHHSEEWGVWLGCDQASFSSPLLSTPLSIGDNSPPLPVFPKSPHGRFPWSRHRRPARRQSTTPTAAATFPLSVMSLLIPLQSKMDTTAPRIHWEGLMERMLSTEMTSRWGSAQRCPWTWRTRFAWRCRGRKRRRRKRRMMWAT